jgi:hypothetical protein
MAEALLPRWLRYKPVLNFPRFREAMAACAEDAAGAEHAESRTPATKDEVRTTASDALKGFRWRRAAAC